MELNAAGLMVRNVLDVMFSNNQYAELTSMVIMPNHLHCLICIMADGGMGLPQMMRYLKSRTTVEYIHGVKEKVGLDLTDSYGKTDIMIISFGIRNHTTR